MNEQILARVLASLAAVEARATSFITDPKDLAKAAQTMASVRQQIADAIRKQPGPLPADYQLPGVARVCERLDDARQRVLALQIPDKSPIPPAIEKLRTASAPTPLAAVPETTPLIPVSEWQAQFDWKTFGKAAMKKDEPSASTPSGPDVADWALSAAAIPGSSLNEPDPTRKRSATELFNDEISAPSLEPPPAPSKHKHFDSWLGES